jgi:hypothetical protein
MSTRTIDVMIDRIKPYKDNGRKFIKLHEVKVDGEEANRWITVKDHMKLYDIENNLLGWDYLDSDKEYHLKFKIPSRDESKGSKPEIEVTILHEFI